MNEAEFSFFEKCLLTEIATIEQNIKALTAEKITLAKQLQKVRIEKEGLQFTTRKNSTNRILVESSTILYLKKQREKGINEAKAGDLFQQALFFVNDLNKNTLRTYLNRMKKRGVIKPTKHVSIWRLP